MRLCSRAGICDRTKKWVVEHIKHYMDVSNCGPFDFNFNYAEIVSRRRRAHQAAVDKEINAPLVEGAVDVDSPLLDAEMANDEMWRKGPYGRRWLAGDYSNPCAFYSLASLSNLEGVGKENLVTFRYDTLAHVVFHKYVCVLTATICVCRPAGTVGDAGNKRQERKRPATIDTSATSATSDPRVLRRLPDNEPGLTELEIANRVRSELLPRPRRPRAGAVVEGR